MADLFDLSDGAPPQQPQRGKFSAMAVLSALLPVAMARGGREGVAGLLQGFQQAQLRKQQELQQQQAFGLQQQQFQSAQADRTADNARQDAAAKMARDQLGVQRFESLVKPYGEFDTPEQFENYLSLVEPQARQWGIEPGALRARVPSKDKLLRKRVESAIKSIKPEMMEAYHQARASLQVKGETVPYDVWSQYTTQGVDEQGKPVTLPAAPQRPVTLSEGAVLVDPVTGEVIAQGSPKREPKGPQPNYEWVVRNGRPVQIREGTARAGDRPYAAGKEDTGPSAYSQERNVRNLQSIDELVGKVNNWTTGAGSLLRRIPATDARNFAAELDTLKANIAFGELTAMREASKTGGALGQVSNIELGLLQSALGALDAGQSPANIRAQLLKIRASIERWNAAHATNAPTGRPKNPFRR